MRTSTASKEPLLAAQTYEKLADVYDLAHQTANATEAKRARELALKKVASTGDAAIAKLEKSFIASENTRLDYYEKAENGATAYREMGLLSGRGSL